MSAAPTINSIARLSGIDLEKAKITVAPPNAATASSIFGPTPVLSGRKEKNSAVSAAPMAGAMASWLRPVAPTCSMSRA